mgnify:CR=1 FL=1
MPPWSGDETYLEAFDAAIEPELRRFEPDILLVSAGFDGHIDDPMAELAMTDTAFDAITLDVMEIANKYCKGRVLSILEGGYDLETLGRCVVKHIKCMM